MGFTNDVTVAVWIGHDNADGKRRTLGGGSTGGHVAVPIFEPVIQAVWAYAAPKAALAPPEAKRQLACQSIDLESGEAQSGRAKAFSECFRVDRKGKIIDTQYRLMSHEEASHAKHDRKDGAVRKAASAPRNGTPAMRGHNTPGDRSNNGAGSRGLDNSGATTGESGSRAGRAGLIGATVGAHRVRCLIRTELERQRWLPM